MQARTLWVRFAVTWHGPTTAAFHVGHSSTAVRRGPAMPSGASLASLAGAFIRPALCATRSGTRKGRALYGGVCLSSCWVQAWKAALPEGSL